jgi:hypothetical protein
MVDDRTDMSGVDDDEWDEASPAEKLEGIRGDGREKANEATAVLTELLEAVDEDMTLPGKSDIEDSDIEEYVAHTETISERAEAAKLELRDLIAWASLAEDLVDDLSKSEIETTIEDDFEDVDEVDLGLDI